MYSPVRAPEARAEAGRNEASTLLYTPTRWKPLRERETYSQ
jgi:hypothetical protein